MILLPMAASFGATYSSCSARERREEEKQHADEACIQRGGIPARWGDCYLGCEREKTSVQSAR
jgi:hypothetical protein